MALFQVKERKRQIFNVPQASGDYASERITLGAVAPGEGDQSFLGVTALIEGTAPSGAVVELWLAQVTDGAALASNRTDDNYFYAGQLIAPPRVAFTSAGSTVSFGSATWALAGYPGAQLRVRSGGVSGPLAVSATTD